MVSDLHRLAALRRPAWRRKARAVCEEVPMLEMLATVGMAAMMLLVLSIGAEYFTRLIGRRQR
jgi:hypothetical protein